MPAFIAEATVFLVLAAKKSYRVSMTGPLVWSRIIFWYCVALNNHQAMCGERKNFHQNVLN